MKLFLMSQWLLPEFREAFEELAGKHLDGLKVALIENGADDEKGEPKWVRTARQSLLDAGMRVTQVDLREYTDQKYRGELRELLGANDVVWVGGGNTFYLNWLLHNSGAAELIKELAADGRIYAGGSAGAIVAGPTIRGFEEADDASFAPKFVPEGMSLTETVILPHSDHNFYGPIMERLARQLPGEGYAVQPLADREALVIDGDYHTVIAA